MIPKVTKNLSYNNICKVVSKCVNSKDITLFNVSLVIIIVRGSFLRSSRSTKASNHHYRHYQSCCPLPSFSWKLVIHPGRCCLTYILHHQINSLSTPHVRYAEAASLSSAIEEFMRKDDQYDVSNWKKSRQSETHLLAVAEGDTWT